MTTEEELSEWLLAWFRGRGMRPGATRAEELRTNYFDAGTIDSFGIIELIADLEQRYHVAFTPDDFQDPRFSTIMGLATVVLEKSRPPSS
ncbi:MAG: acyl carrier protein [Polyangiaceae bacterium]